MRERSVARAARPELPASDHDGQNPCPLSLELGQYGRDGQPLIGLAADPCFAFRNLRRDTEYEQKGMDEYAVKMMEQAERDLLKNAAQLGYELTPKPTPAPT